MNPRRRVVLALGAAALCGPGRLGAQPKVRRIGYLTVHTISEPPTPERAAFLAGLRELGYQPGRNLAIEYRAADNDLERMPELVAEFVKLRVEVLVVSGTEATAAAKAGTATLPVVFASAGDPVYAGLVNSYARPGGNLTGLSFIAPELGAKRVALVKEILPRVRRLAVMWNALDPTSGREWDQAREAARTLGIAVDPMPISLADDVARALAALPKSRPDALLVIVDSRMVGFRKIIAEAAIKARIACVAGWREYVTAGALASYAPDFRALFHRAAFYVDRILRGAKPADLPVEQPSKFELVINLKTAKQLGITLPPTVLVSADEVIQ
jgi:putative ABC transport system substrate-binding protein